MINKQILVTSINKQIEKSKVYGKLDLSVLYFFNLVMYYIDYTNDVVVLNTHNRKLKELAYYLKYKYPNILCNYKIISPIAVLSGDNTAPTVEDFDLDIDGNRVINIGIEPFIENYEDVDNDIYKNLLILPNNLNTGKLFFNGVEITAPIELSILPVKNIGGRTTVFDLRYVVPLEDDTSTIPREYKGEVNDSFDFKVSDSKNLFSTTKTATITNSVYVENEPAEIGDVFITTSNRTELTLDLTMFTNLMSPPYSDPENDLIDAIRIDGISSSNQGVFLLNGIAIQEGDIITREDLIAGDFKHVGPNVDSISTDTIDFSARDEGSLIWVQ
jgi:hypothetical protein